MRYVIGAGWWAGAAAVLVFQGWLGMRRWEDGNGWEEKDLGGSPGENCIRPEEIPVDTAMGAGAEGGATVDLRL